MTSRDLYLEIKKLREESWAKVKSGKMTLEDFVYTSFNYIRQQRYKPLVKAHDVESILYNYLYWTIQIEKKIQMERELIQLNLGSEEILNQVLVMYIKRRDQMVRRLIWEKKQPFKAMYLVFNDTVEILMDNGDVIYSSQENLDKINMPAKDIQKSKDLAYLSLIKLINYDQK